MQAFHNNLVSKSKQNDAYQRAMVRLTQVSLSQMAALEGAPSWDPWDAPSS